MNFGVVVLVAGPKNRLELRSSEAGVALHYRPSPSLYLPSLVPYKDGSEYLRRAMSCLSVVWGLKFGAVV